MEKSEEEIKQFIKELHKLIHEKYGKAKIQLKGYIILDEFGAVSWYADLSAMHEILGRWILELKGNEARLLQRWFATLPKEEPERKKFDEKSFG